MKNLRLLLILLTVSICSMHSAWARTAPTFPTAKSLESGKTYYLYNVGSDRFLFYNNSIVYDPKAFSDKGSAVKISLVNGTQYSIQFVDNDYYLHAGTESLSCHNYYASDQEGFRFTIHAVDGGYTIQRVYNSVESEYIGYNNDEYNRWNCNLVEGNIVWQLLDVEESTRFIAQRNLYRALESAGGYVVDKYEAVYENGSSSNYALQEAADALNKAVDASNTIKIPEWSDYKVLFEMNVSDPWSYSSDSYDIRHWVTNGTASLNAVVEVNEEATFVYEYDHYQRGGDHLEVYLDEALVQQVNLHEGNEQQRFFIEMAPGKHEIMFKCINMSENGSNFRLTNIGVEKTPTIIVSLKEPGSLGTEVLSQTDHVQNVRKLIVSGEMNDDDWARILMMTSIFSLDLTNVTNTEIPEKQLSRDYHSNELSFLHEVKLPNTLKVIQKYAFDGTYLDEITFPEGLTTIEKYAFYNTRIQKALIPESVTTIGDYAFEYCKSLQQATFPAAAKVVPQSCFRGCNVLQPFKIPEGIISIKSSAFYDCYSFNSTIPSTITEIGSYAFWCSSMNNVKINEGTTINSYAFSHCENLTNIELPTTMYNEVYYMLSSCPNLTDVYFKSPTMVKSEYKNIFDNTASNITIHVPSYLVNTYKLDEYWYNYNITGFSTADVTDWFITQPLKMSEGERFDGTPNVSVLGGGYWTINGDDAMTIKNFQTEQKIELYNNKIGSSSQVLSNCKNISITGDYTHKVYTESNRWYFVTLPFDTKVGDITCNASYVVRYYDGANRAENGTGGNWKNYSKDDIIPAGTGFIFQTSQEGWSTFKAQDNASKQYVLANKIFTKALSVNASENKEHKGWNLVGNPWMSYYNIHKLNFTAPITCWNAYNQNYIAYSVIDDDYAILPNEAFFVQCPNEEIASISFPIDGRQMTDEIESQNAARYFDGMTESEYDASPSVVASRKLIDIELSDGERTDKTRFVLNANAKMDYETSCDASKFFSMNASVPQIYTIQNGIQMAINERPAGDGIIQIGVLIPASGTYTINSNRNAFLEAVLVDKQTGTETNLSSDSYTFSAEAGTDTNRFELHLSAGEVTGINVVDKTQTEKNVYYNLNGQRVDVPTTGVYIVNGKKVIIK